MAIDYKQEQLKNKKQTSKLVRIIEDHLKGDAFKDATEEQKR